MSDTFFILITPTSHVGVLRYVSNLLFHTSFRFYSFRIFILCTNFFFHTSLSYNIGWTFLYKWLYSLTILGTEEGNNLHCDIIFICLLRLFLYLILLLLIILLYYIVTLHFYDLPILYHYTYTLLTFGFNIYLAKIHTIFY